MKVAQTGNLSCMAVANGDSIPSANDIVSIDNKTHGTYDNTIRATANVVEIYSIYNLLEGVDYDVYCALDDLVSDKLDIYTSRVISHTIATEITGTTVKLITTFDAAQYVRCIILYFGSDTPSAAQIYNGNDASGNPALKASLASAMSIAGTPHTVTIDSLSPGQQYDAYCAQTQSLASHRVSFTTNFVVKQPSILENTGTGIRLLTSFSSNGFVRCAVTKSGSEPPLASEILDGSVSGVIGEFPTKQYVDGWSDYKLWYKGLVPGTAYNLSCAMNFTKSTRIQFVAMPAHARLFYAPFPSSCQLWNASACPTFLCCTPLLLLALQCHHTLDFSVLYFPYVSLRMIQHYLDA